MASPTILPNSREDAFKQLEARISALLDLVGEKTAEIDELKRQREEDDLAQIQRLVDMITPALETPTSVLPPRLLGGLLNEKGEQVAPLPGPQSPLVPPLGPT